MNRIIEAFVALSLLFMVVSCSDDDTNLLTTIAVENATFTVAENPSVGYSIGTLEASASRGSEELAIAYSITSQSVENAVSIDPNSGEIKVVSPAVFDLDVNEAVILTVEVRADGQTKDVTVTINISKDEGVVIDANDTTFTIKENPEVGAVIGLLEASASLGGQEQEVSFSLVSQSEIGAVKIDENSGQLEVTDVSKFDHDINPMIIAVVTVSSGEVTENITVTIAIENVMEGFTTTWQTTTANESITIPTRSAEYSYNYTISWGDGSVEIGVTEDAMHTYTEAGTYMIEITGQFPAIYLGASGANAQKIRKIEQWSNTEWRTMEEAFKDGVNLPYNAKDLPDLSRVTSLASMFRKAELFNGSIGNWDVSSVTDMNRMFASARAFNQSLSEWDVSNVTSMHEMFAGAYAFNGKIRSWDVSNVTNMMGMFSSAFNFNQDIGGWNVGNVTNMRYTFANNSSLGETSFNQNLNSWNVSNVKDMSFMFVRANNFNGEISNWDVGNVTKMEQMFGLASKFNQDIGDWDVSNVTNMNSMFYSALMFNQDIGRWTVSNVTNMRSMFFSARTFNQDVSNWDVSNVNNMSLMFTYAKVFNQNLGQWDIGKVNTIDRMLEGANLSNTNYDATLQGWSELSTVPQNLTLGAIGLEYCSFGETARNILINDKGWAITGDSRANAADCGE